MTVDRWERRQLCDDGACVGVIGQDGTCKVCGKPAPDWGDLRKPGRISSKSESDEDVEADESPESEPIASPAKVAASAGKVSAWNERKLCADGACVGLIDDDGKCKVCRKPAEGAAATEDEEEEDDEIEASDADADVEDEAEEEEEGDDGEDEDDGEEDEDDEEEDDDAEVAQDEEDEDDDDDDDDKRTLCSDGACVGVIGDNGKCKLCGKAAA